MSLPNVNYNARMVDMLVKAGAFKSAPFTLVDVGCSLGLEQYWRIFGKDLRATGIDPIVEECERLTREEKNPAVRYVAAWIKNPSFPSDTHYKTDQPFARTSAWAAVGAMSKDARDHGEAPKVTYSERNLTLDELVAEAGYEAVDFIKVDTDGGDLQVISSGPEALKSTLGVEIECAFQGGVHEWANTFANVYNLLRPAGFSLFDMDNHRYSRAALPARFEYIIPAGTDQGQLIWSNLLFLRDAGSPQFEANWGPIDEARIPKLAALYELYGLNDCAAELILKHRAAFDRVLSSQKALDCLATEWWPEAGSYDNLVQKFNADPTAFYPPSPYDTKNSEEEKTIQSVFRQVYFR
jgi:FkbM family methyltransferase